MADKGLGGDNTCGNSHGRGPMSEARQRKLVGMMAQRNIEVEDDIYGELMFEPAVSKAPKGPTLLRDTVLYLPSFSKTISPGLRPGG